MLKPFEGHNFGERRNAPQSNIKYEANDVSVSPTFGTKWKQASAESDRQPTTGILTQSIRVAQAFASVRFAYFSATARKHCFFL